MKDTFDIRKFLTENKITAASQQTNEAYYEYGRWYDDTGRMHPSQGDARSADKKNHEDALYNAMRRADRDRESDRVAQARSDAYAAGREARRAEKQKAIRQKEYEAKERARRAKEAEKAEEKRIKNEPKRQLATKEVYKQVTGMMEKVLYSPSNIDKDITSIAEKVIDRLNTTESVADVLPDIIALYDQAVVGPKKEKLKPFYKPLLGQVLDKLREVERTYPSIPIKAPVEDTEEVPEKKSIWDRILGRE